MAYAPRDALYEKGKIKITHLYSADPEKENEIISVQEHELWLKEIDGEWNRYFLPQGL